MTASSHSPRSLTGHSVVARRLDLLKGPTRWHNHPNTQLGCSQYQSPGPAAAHAFYVEFSVNKSISLLFHHRLKSVSHHDNWIIVDKSDYLESHPKMLMAQWHPFPKDNKNTKEATRLLLAQGTPQTPRVAVIEWESFNLYIIIGLSKRNQYHDTFQVLS